MGARTISFPSYAAARLRHRPPGRRRVGRLFWGTGALLFGGLVVLDLARATAPGEVAFLLLLFMICVRGWLGRPAVARTGSADERAALQAGVAGEDTVGRCLAEALPPTYVVLNNLPLPGALGDVDHLVVGPTGAFVVETKNLDGAIARDDDGVWHRTKVGRHGSYPAWIGDPDAQVGRAIRALRAHLEWQAPRLCARTQLWIEGLVVFPHAGARLETGPGRFPAIRPEEAVERILTYRPRRQLAARDVEELARVLAGPKASVAANVPARAQGGQALIEVVLTAPLLLMLAFGAVGLGRVVQGQLSVAAVAREAARAAALADTPADAAARGAARGSDVAVGYRLDNGSLQLVIDPGTLDRGGQVRAAARYEIALDDLPLLGWARVPVAGSHVERIDLWRSRWQAEAGP